MELGIVSSYEVRTIDRVWLLPRGDYELTLARLAAAPGISIGRTVTKTVTNADEFVMQAKFVLSQTARCYLLIRAILQEINGEKRPEKTKYFFIVSNSTIFEINVIFIKSKPMFPIAHG